MEESDDGTKDGGRGAGEVVRRRVYGYVPFLSERESETVKTA